MNREEQLALLIDLENFFGERTTEFVKVNLQELGELSKEIFGILPISPETCRRTNYKQKHNGIGT